MYTWLYRPRRKGKAYVKSCHQTLGLNSIIMETSPLLKRLARDRMILLRIPNQHIRRIRHTSSTTERLDSRRRRIKHIIRINDTDLIDSVEIRLGPRRRRQIRTSSYTRTDQTLSPKIIEVSTQLIVAGLLGIEVRESRQLVQWGNRAPIVRGDTVVGVTDQECPVEPGLDVAWHHSGVTWFGEGVVWVWTSGCQGSIDVAVHLTVSVGVSVDYAGSCGGAVDTGRREAIGGDAVGRGCVFEGSSYTALDASQ